MKSLSAMFALIMLSVLLMANLEAQTPTSIEVLKVGTPDPTVVSTTKTCASYAAGDEPLTNLTLESYKCVARVYSAQDIQAWFQNYGNAMPFRSLVVTPAATLKAGQCTPKQRVQPAAMRKVTQEMVATASPQISNLPDGVYWVIWVAAPGDVELKTCVARTQNVQQILYSVRVIQ